MSEKFTLYNDSKYENHATNELPLASKNMSKKEELAREYSFNIPSEIYNTLETDADRLLWKSETERAFEAGWDACKAESVETIKTAEDHAYFAGSEAMREKLTNKVSEFVQDNVREYHKSGVFHVAEFIKDLRKAMEE